MNRQGKSFPPLTVPPPDQTGINAQVDQQDDAPQPELNLRREPRRVDQRNQIMLDETVFISRLPGHPAQIIFPGCQRAPQVQALHDDSPGHGWQVQAEQARPAQQQQATEQHEQDEAQMQQYQRIGGDSPEHHFPLSRSIEKNTSQIQAD